MDNAMGTDGCALGCTAMVGISRTCEVFNRLHRIAQLDAD